MPDDASRALHETVHPNDYQVPEQYLTTGLGDPRAHAQEGPLYELAMPSISTAMPGISTIRQREVSQLFYEQGMPYMGISGPQEVSHGNHFTASTDKSVANGNELHRLVHAPEAALPLDLVGCPVARSHGGASSATMCVVLLALLVADISACLRAVVNTLFTIWERTTEMPKGL